jgi:hypothetical protein
LSDALTRRGRALRKLGQPAASIQDFDRAIALEDRPDPLADLRSQRGLSMLATGNHEKAFAEALAVAQISQAHPGTIYNTACICALAAAQVSGNAALKEKYAAQAVMLLQLVRQKGLFRVPADATNLSRDPDLDSLRQREDFRKFLAEVKSALPTK